LWARQQTGGAFLPTGVGSVEIHRLSLPKGALTCVVDGKNVPDLKAVADVAFLDEAGRVVFEMKDVETHRLPDDNAFAGEGAGVLADDRINAPAGNAE
jgi:Polyketide synthase dehydratase